MPELPDVEVYRRYMDKTSLNQKITGVKVLAERILQGVSEKDLVSRLEGKQFVSVDRHGKYMFAKLDSDGYAFFHFGMTGYLKYWRGQGQSPDHSRALFELGNSHLAFVLQRKLGKLGLTESIDKFVSDNDLGPDALSIDKSSFKNILNRSNAYVKSTLMNQKHLAGIGNIYSDEILFQARIHPKTKSSDLDDGKIDKVFDKMKSVLKTAIEDKANPDEMPDSFLLPNRKKGAHCPCGGDVKSVKVSGRTSYFCPKCQKPA